jgi:hypothetical protein
MMAQMVLGSLTSWMQEFTSTCPVMFFLMCVVYVLVRMVRCAAREADGI